MSTCLVLALFLTRLLIPVAVLIGMGSLMGRAARHRH